MRNTKLTLIILLFVLISIALWCQYDEKQILIQQATNFYNQRQYTQAELLYRQVLERWPNDQTAILQSLNISYMTGDIDKAEQLLKDYGAYLPNSLLLDHEIQILVQRGKPEQAWEKAMQSLQLNPQDQNRYRILAAYFERRGFFDQVLRLYELGRTKYNNPDLFILEYANSALNYQRYELALTEYLRWLDKNPANLYFVNNQCKTILDADSTLIEVISEAAQGGTEVMQELLAGTLLARKQYVQALDIYKEMNRPKLVSFANQQYASLNDEVAQLAFEWLKDTEPDIFNRSLYTYNLSQIGFRNQRYERADSLVNIVIADSLLNLPQNRWRSPVSYQSRRLKTQLSLILTRDPAEALKWAENAKSFTRNNRETQEMELEIARLLILENGFIEAEKHLKAVTDATLMQEKDYLVFLSSLWEDDIPKADSLMNEYVISWPGGTFTNDAIYLMMHVLGLQDEARAHFMAAYKSYQLKDPIAITMLISPYAQNQDEELLMLAAEWAITLGDKPQALELLSHDWEDALSAEYAAWLILFLQESSREQIRQAQEFLRKNPNSIFSPSFRTHLSREPRGRME